MITYVVGGRYNYYAIDVIKDGICIRTAILTFKTRKLANEVASQLNQAYNIGRLESREIHEPATTAQV